MNKIKPRRYLLLAASIALIIFATDIMIPLGVAFGVAYIIVILITLRTPYQNAVIIAAIICTFLVLLGLILSPEGGEAWKVYFNRVISIVAIWIVALLVDQIKKDKEKLLQQSKTELKEAQRAAKIGIFRIDFLENSIWLSEELYRYFGFEKEEAETNLNVLYKYINIDDIARVRQTIEKVHLSESADSIDLEYRVSTNKGAELYVYTVLIPEKNSTGQTVYCIGICQDITDRKKAEDKLRASEEKYRAIFESSRVGMALCEMDGTLVDVNNSYLDIIGYSKEEALSLTYWDITPKDYEDEETKQLHSLTETGRYGPYEKEYIRKNGSRVPVLLNGTILKGVDGVDRIWSLVLNISERKKTEKELQKLSRAVESSSSAVYITDLDSNIEYVNPKFTEITGYSREEIIGKSPSILKSNKTIDSVYSDMWDTISSGGEWKGEFHNRKKDGSLYWARNSISGIKNNEGTITHYVAIQEDVTHEYELSEKLSYQASHDALTGLVNRCEFERRAERLLSTVKKNAGVHALCFLDLDQFKVVNDTCGHTAGDELLRQLTSVLQKVVRNRDTLARLGGDEFGVLMEHCPLDNARRVATSILTAIQNYLFSWEGHTFKLGVSIGLVPITSATINLTQLLKDADVACYIAKDKGRNRVHVNFAEDAEIAQRHGEMQWVSRLNKALEENRFCLYAQNIIPLDENTNKHYELLIRMVEDDNRTIPPGAFLPSAERYNLISKLDRWVIENTFKLLSKNPAFLKNINFCSINLSGQSITENSFLDFVTTQFDEFGIQSDKVCFEITETAAISNLSKAIKFISTLKKLGCRFALDDFGSGLSSFGYLKRLPVDYLKIDGMFVKDIVDDPINHAMVRSINDIGQVMGMQTIAEFVENDEIKGMLREIGVNYAQGFGIGKPLPLNKLLNGSDNVTDIKIVKFI